MSIYWHDDKELKDILVSSIQFSSTSSGETKTVSGQLTVSHRSDGELWGYAYATFTKGGGSAWTPNSGSVMTDWKRLTPIQLVQINSFAGDSIYNSFRATYTPVEGKNYTYGLKISIPNVVELVLFDNYVSGTDVTLSSSQIEEIKSRISGNTVTLGGVIEAYDNGTYVGESSELTTTCSTVEENKARIRINGSWKEAKPYIRINNQWKEAKPYIRVNNTWKEGI